MLSPSPVDYSTTASNTYLLTNTSQQSFLKNLLVLTRGISVVEINFGDRCCNNLNCGILPQVFGAEAFEIAFVVRVLNYPVGIERSSTVAPQNLHIA